MTFHANIYLSLIFYLNGVLMCQIYSLSQFIFILVGFLDKKYIYLINLLYILF